MVPGNHLVKPKCRRNLRNATQKPDLTALVAEEAKSQPRGCVRFIGVGTTVNEHLRCCIAFCTGSPLQRMASASRNSAFGDDRYLTSTRNESRAAGP